MLEDILHGNDSLRAVPDEEGELAILAARLYKMTLRFREQAEQLTKEKSYLKDSLADISHQIKTPLTAAELTLHRLRRPGLSQEERADLGRETERLLRRLEALVELLLKTARLESGTVELKKEKVRVDEALDKALEPLKISLELKGITVREQVPESVCFEGDFLWSVEALQNIIKNCMEHTPEGGSIFLQAEENPLYTAIHIRDTGPGFPREDLPHLFERFYRGENEASSGNGIGLALAASVWKMQNGTIKAGNAREGGAEFHVRIYKGAV